MCPDSDPDVRALRQEISKSVDALEKQINFLPSASTFSASTESIRNRAEGNTKKLPRLEVSAV